MRKQTDRPDFVFILGIMPRSGTHYLTDLLCLHPECARSAIPEDGLVATSSILMKYARRNYHQWQADGDLPDINAENLLIQGLGEGLMIFLQQARKKAMVEKKIPSAELLQTAEPKYLVAKTPEISNIRNFFKLFPGEKLLILIRDGRSLVESINLSFKYNREEAMRDWANAAWSILEMEKRWASEEKPFLIIKYEELYANTENEMMKILSFLDLDAGRYDFKQALNSPVIGSSVFKRGGGAVHWEPVIKTPEFNPLLRSAEWTRAQHERFNWLAGKELVSLGYEPVKFERAKSVWVARNYLYDFGYWLKTWFRRFARLNQFIGHRLKMYFKK